jgi:hypothetical protein
MTSAVREFVPLRESHQAETPREAQAFAQVERAASRTE